MSPVVGFTSISETTEEKISILEERAVGSIQIKAQRKKPSKYRKGHKPHAVHKDKI